MIKYITENIAKDGIDLRGFLHCMAWTGTGVLWSMAGGVARGQVAHHATGKINAELSFVQISDSHIGFKKEANPDVIGTLREAVNHINSLPAEPAFLIHTGDISHLSKPEEFDTVDQILKSARVGRSFLSPANTTS